MAANKEVLIELQQEIEVQFSDLKLLEKAITHKSYANEKQELKIKDNERLEFLGDSVLDLIISRYIFLNYPDHPEGELAKIRSVVVSAPILAEKAREIELGKYMLLGKGEEMTGGRKRDSILADGFEAVVGSIYLDQGLEASQEFILDLLVPNIKEVEQGSYVRDYKTLLQELIQKDSNLRPDYKVVEEKGPDHNKRFTVEVIFDQEILGVGVGFSKKEAEQKAAKKAIAKVK
ncbi:ribonuclease III [Halobacteroides halobius DSM 5150]|uniref:Ribonuclease 3 n=1 Tax=Halobacteroides halobius (strain ATCC 35273 / DSM 5150 / MD-1) TaxID=748449 RepID=L0KAH5_HALHC|nr:ribonuclease III [Halobacteroides halobius]AGB41359.1 ribonuclease III [Halobacteroides halobius DSM 5150]